MTPTLFLIQLAVLFMPGVIWAYLDVHFATKGKPTQLEFLARVLVFGLASYLVAYFLFWCFGWTFETPELDKLNVTSVINQAVAWQIAAASVIGFLLAILWMYGVNYKWLTRFLQTIGATKTYGDEDVWDYILNSNSAESEYVHVRDFENEIVYAGWVGVFSETGRVREMMLRDVCVYDLDGELLFEVPRIYIARKAEGMHVEFPATDENIKDVK